MTRFPDWPERLAEYIEAALTRPFAWGPHDCCSFAANWIVFATGADPFSTWRGYDESRGALRRLDAAGGLYELWCSMLGAPVPAALAQRGDIVTVTLRGRMSAAICVGTHAAGPGEAGLARVPITQGDWAWRV